MSRPPYLRPARPPAQCTCTRMTVATLAETLRCPLAWHELPGGRWRHAWQGRVRGMRIRGTGSDGAVLELTGGLT